MKLLPLILLLLLPIVGTSPALAEEPVSISDDQRKAAQKMFEAGDSLYEGRRYEEAADAFRQSHNLIHSPNSRLMLARSLRELGRKDEAIFEFQGTIADAAASAGRYPEAKQAATAELDALEAEEKRATAVEQSPAPKSPPVTVAAAPSPLNAAPAAPTTNPMRTYAWIATGVGAVGLGGFGVFAYLDRKTYRALQDDCPNGQCGSGAESRIDKGRSYQLGANVALALALTGAATATTLFILSSPKQSETSTLAVSAGPGQLFFEGQF